MAKTSNKRENHEWTKRHDGHINPFVQYVFCRLGKVLKTWLDRSYRDDNPQSRFIREKRNIHLEN